MDVANPLTIGAVTVRSRWREMMNQRHRHAINFTDAATPIRVASGVPAGRLGVLGAETHDVGWRKWDVGRKEEASSSSHPPSAIPHPPSNDTRTPYTLDFAGADGGKPAHYMLRWVNSRGETGPWSETETATIGA